MSTETQSFVCSTCGRPVPVPASESLPGGWLLAAAYCAISALVALSGESMRRLRKSTAAGTTYTSDG